ncbi:class I SAM-dependent rRNA methyltransferase [Dermatobacter hominis]|uniref:class I SAM-dependent rRNA methyltransferase n=1 Tax=Dermatobacter hominis TaxID=2884263 RepID=UPI001D0FA7E8|nr:class I SAM-dependent rRNA methyltransferase [Dermatobacter hominis]UDY36543.1 class I SAM-dependent rRNA methyltransferase [Dermatobacter hominis]
MTVDPDDGDDRTPPASAPALAVRLHPDALRHVRRGHPWVFDGSLESVRGGRHGDGTGDPGDVAVVFDDRRRFAAVGLWDPASPIRIKVLAAGERAEVGPALWRDRLRDAATLRRPLLDRADTTALRLVHGENDRLPGVVIDLYGPASGPRAAVLKLYSSAWFPHLDDLVAALDAVAAEGVVPAVGPVVLRLSRSVARGPRPEGLDDGVVLRAGAAGEPDLERAEVLERVEFLERGLRFTADLRHGQKTGWFLDQRDNRVLVGSMARGARVLDVFCCGGGFTVHAAAGGAESVHSVDLSPHAVADTERHLALNRDRATVARARHRGTVGDAFEVMDALGRAGETYDLVVVDPPSFASRRRDVTGALRAYGRLTELAVWLVRPGGTLVQASCSSRITADDLVSTAIRAAPRAGADLVVVRQTGQPVDHPVGFSEGAYLKALVARVER